MYITIRYYIIMIDIEIILNLTVAPDEFVLDKFEKYMTYPHYPIYVHITNEKHFGMHLIPKLTIITNYLGITRI